MSKNRIKVTAPVLRTRADMELCVTRIAELKIAQQSVTVKMDAELNAIRENHARVLADLDDQITLCLDSAAQWANANPAAFNGQKSIDMTAAVVGYRTGTPALKPLSGWTFDRVLERLKNLNFAQFIRTKEEVDKQALLAARETTDLRALGLRVAHEETFFVEPKITEVATRETVPSI